MQLRIVSAVAIYLGSYLPLSLILLGQDIDFGMAKQGICPPHKWSSAVCAIPLKHPFSSLLATGVCIVCLAFTLAALRLLPVRQRITIAESKHIPADLINYVIPYIVSFISLDYSDPAKMVGFAIFLGWLFWITFETGQIIMNPVLSVLGWRLFEVRYSFLQSPDILTGRLLASAEIAPGQTYRQGDLQDIMIVKADTKEDADGDAQ